MSEHSKNGNEYAIVMLSLGERPWAYDAFKSFEWIAPMWGADTYLITEDTATDLDTSQVSTRTGRPNKRAYALKSYYPWLFLTSYRYKKVLMVDDGCIVNPGAPNIFAEYQEAHFAYAVTSAKHAQLSFSYLEDLSEHQKIKPVPLIHEYYGNSGVVLYDQSTASHFSPEKISEAQACLDRAFPHQTLLYYLLQRGAVEVTMIPNRWNDTPRFPSGMERKNASAARDYVDDLHIAHITGHFTNRYHLVSDIAARFEEIRQ